MAQTAPRRREREMARASPQASARESASSPNSPKVAKAFAWVGGAIVAGSLALGTIARFVGAPSAAPSIPPVAQVAPPSFQQIPAAPNVSAPVAPAPAPVAGNPQAVAQAPNISAGAEGSLSNANPLPQPVSGAESLTSPNSNVGSAPSHNPSPAEIQGPQINSDPSPNTGPNANTNPNTGANPAPNSGQEPAPQTQSQPPAQSNQPPPNNNGPPLGAGNNTVSNENCIAPFAPCGNPFASQRFPKSVELAKRNELPAPAYKAMEVFYPPTGEFVHIESLADLEALRDGNRKGWLSFLASYGQLEVSRNMYYPSGTLPDDFWYSAEFISGDFWYSKEMARILWAALNEHSFNARIACNPEQQASAPRSKFVIRILNNENLPVISFEESYQRIHGGKYPVSASYINSLSIQQLIDEGYIALVTDVHVLEFTGNAPYGNPNGFMLLLPNSIGARFDYLVWRYSDPSTGRPPWAVGFDFPAVEPLNGMVGANLMAMVIDEPDVHKNHIFGDESGPLLPLQWTVEFIKGSEDIVKVSFDVSAVIDESLDPAPKVVR